MIHDFSFRYNQERVSEEYRLCAEDVFKELSKAYKENDLKRVSEILAELENGNLLFPTSTIQEKEKLQYLAQQLRSKLAQIVAEMAALQENETYQLIANLSDWAAYFAEIHADLQQEKHSFS